MRKPEVSRQAAWAALGIAVSLLPIACQSQTRVAPAASPPGPCRLPVFGPLAGEGGAGTHEGAFLSFPSGSVELDPGSLITSVNGTWQTSTQPVLKGTSQGSFDRAAGRWVPAPPEQVSPDGSSYAYVELPMVNGQFGGSRIHLVTVATGSDQVVYDQGQYDRPVFAPEGIYLVHRRPQADADDSVFLLDPVRGSLRTIFSGGLNWYVERGFGWSADVSPGDAVPPNKGGGDRLLRLDLKTGSATRWFRDPGFLVAELSIDSGGQVLVGAGDVSGDHNQLWLVSGPNSARKVYDGPVSANYRAAVADDHGFWLISGSSVHLLDSRGALRRIANTPFAGYGARFAGDCR